MLKRLLENINLDFGGELEDAYRHETYVSSLTSARNYLIISIILYAGFTVLDYLAMPYNRDAAFYIRFIVVIPGLGLALAASYQNFFEKFHRPILTAVVLLQGYGYLFMIALSGVGELSYTGYYPALFIIILLPLIFLRLRFYNIFLIILSIVIGYEYVLISLQRMFEGGAGGWQLPVLIVNNGFFITINAGFLVLGFMLEHSRRMNYMQSLNLSNGIKNLNKEKADLTSQKDDLKLALKELKVVEKRMSAIVNNDIAGIGILDINNNYKFVNSKWAEMLGYSEEELLGKRTFQVTHPGDRERTDEFFRKLIDGSLVVFNLEKRYVRKDGSCFWGNMNISPVQNENGETDDIIVIVVDITARREFEERLYESRENLRQLNDEKDRFLERINNELLFAAEHVRSLIPKKIKQGPIRTDWQLIPSEDLGGDSFGYHWLDDDNFAIYLVDVCGHGVAPALHSISVINTIRSQTLPRTDFTKPMQVLTALNEAYQMSDHNDMYFTIWYGIYNKQSRILEYSSGGHPGALLVFGGLESISGDIESVVLQTNNLFIGALEEYDFKSDSVELAANSTLFVFSDGVYEVNEDIEVSKPEGLHGYLMSKMEGQPFKLKKIYKKALKLNSGQKLNDDFSIMRIDFD